MLAALPSTLKYLNNWVEISFYFEIFMISEDKSNSLSCFDDAVLMVWSGLGTKTTWLGLWKDYAYT